jgi:hypothetical protein
MHLLSLALATPPDTLSLNHQMLCADDGVVLITEQWFNRGTHYDREKTLHLHHVTSSSVDSLAVGGWNVNVEMESIELVNPGTDPTPWLRSKHVSQCEVKAPFNLHLVYEDEGWWFETQRVRQTVPTPTPDPLIGGFYGSARVDNSVDQDGTTWLIVYGETGAGAFSEFIVSLPTEDVNHALSRLYNDLGMGFPDEPYSAARLFGNALEYDPTYEAARYNYACALARSGNPDEAMRELARLPPSTALRTRMETDPALASIRDRKDFTDLLAAQPPE